MSDTLQIVIIVFLVVVCVAFGLLAWQLLRRRRDRLRREIDASRASAEERAFNRIHLGRSAAAHLERNGADVSGPRRLLDQASRSYDAGKHDDALALAASAHEALLKQASAAAEGPPAPAVPGPVPAAVPPAGSSPGPSIATPRSPPMATDPSSDAEAPPPGRLPKNKAESHFQLGLLDEELTAGGPAGTTPSTVRGVSAIAAEAHASYDRGDFTEALRIALKGRRALGARLETLPPPSSTPVVEEPAPPAPDTPDRCRQCGQPLRGGDKYCRGCGSPVTATTCARCGDTLEGSDQFCGRCGAPRPS